LPRAERGGSNRREHLGLSLEAGEIGVITFEDLEATGEDVSVSTAL
jgi:hypothetical protein